MVDENCIDAMIGIKDDTIRKALVALAIEKTLLDMGTAVFGEVTARLLKEYDCYIPDCHDHPEYLKKILKDLYGNSYLVIIESIREELEEFVYKKSISEFLDVIECRESQANQLTIKSDVL